MNLITKAPKGTKDILPEDSYKWQIVEDVARRIAVAYGYKEIRTPVFEHTDLFQRSVGEGTDVVQKEMYTFEDKGGRSVTLRPEGTASVARAILENGLHNEALPIKTYYFDSCYRYEKPQSGRYREFHQFGIELFGSDDPAADAEVICFANALFECLGMYELDLEVNSIGCPNCREKYYIALKEYFAKYENELCGLCQERMLKNPLRVLDCKNPKCQEIAKDAPKILDYLCDDCKKHFDSVTHYLDMKNIEYDINPNIVRGLDYYTRTVFEFVDKSKETQNTVCGGGRYDGLVEELGGPHIPALGFGLGMERLMDILNNEEGNALDAVQKPTCDIYIASIGEEAKEESFFLCEEVRSASLNAEYDLSNRSLKAQLKYADKIGAKYSLVLGDNELETERAILKNMKTQEEYDITVDDCFLDEFLSVYNDEQLTNINFDF